MKPEDYFLNFWNFDPFLGGIHKDFNRFWQDKGWIVDGAGWVQVVQFMIRGWCGEPNKFRYERIKWRLVWIFMFEVFMMSLANDTRTRLRRYMLKILNMSDTLSLGSCLYCIHGCSLKRLVCAERPTFNCFPNKSVWFLGSMHYTFSSYITKDCHF